MDINAKVSMIIPAAGFGTRVGCPPAKEILLRAGTQEPLIDAPIRWGQERHMRVIVVTRRNKYILVKHLEEHHPQVHIHPIESSEDWQSTMLQSKVLWSEKNILLLPDTQFSPIGILDKIPDYLDQFDIVMGRHRVSDDHAWGHMWPTSPLAFAVAEKPLLSTMALSSAWGLIGFRKSHGERLFKAQWLSQKTKMVQELQGRLGILDLDYFEDLTR